jgi:hypothetical protein
MPITAIGNSPGSICTSRQPHDQARSGDVLLAATSSAGSAPYCRGILPP